QRRIDDVTHQLRKRCPHPESSRLRDNLHDSGGTTVIQAKAEVEAAKVDGVSAVAAKAMQDVALLSQMEQSLAQAVPHASGRLATVADLAAISIAGVVADAARRIGR
ncbi:hypothetical protein, partial [Nostocoides australiense]